MAVGRIPNTGDLGLEAAGIEIDELGYIRVNDRLETTAPCVWALGDCNGRGAFTTRATMISRSSQRISWTARIARSPTGSPATRSTPTRLSAGSESARIRRDRQDAA